MQMEDFAMPECVCINKSLSYQIERDECVSHASIWQLHISMSVCWFQYHVHHPRVNPVNGSTFVCGSSTVELVPSCGCPVCVCDFTSSSHDNTRHCYWSPSCYSCLFVACPSARVAGRQLYRILVVTLLCLSPLLNRVYSPHPHPHPHPSHTVLASASSLPFRKHV